MKVADCPRSVSALSATFDSSNPVAGIYLFVAALMRVRTRSTSTGLLRRFDVRAKVWLYPGNGGWHFITLSKHTSAQIKRGFGLDGVGWGSLRIRATLGGSTWNSSIFPDKKSSGYVLPIKSSIRRNENVSAGDMVTVHL